MKVRLGFVSNSSSSSFVIFGKIFTRDEFKERCKFTDEEMKIIDKYGVYDFSDRLGGLDYIYLKEGIYLAEGNGWILGSKLFGDADTIIKTVSHIRELFGSGCKVYHGVDTDGEIQLDEGV